MDELNEMFDKLNIVSDILGHKGDAGNSDMYRIITELPMMINQINEIIFEHADDVSPELLVNYMYAHKKFNDEIKPIYLALLVYKEGFDNANK